MCTFLSLGYFTRNTHLQQRGKGDNYNSKIVVTTKFRYILYWIDGTVCSDSLYDTMQYTSRIGKRRQLEKKTRKCNLDIDKEMFQINKVTRIINKRKSRYYNDALSQFNKASSPSKGYYWTYQQHLIQLTIIYSYCVFIP